jgi:hypothetical protein
MPLPTPDGQIRPRFGKSWFDLPNRSPPLELTEKIPISQRPVHGPASMLDIVHMTTACAGTGAVRRNLGADSLAWHRSANSGSHTKSRFAGYSFVSTEEITPKNAQDAQE